MSQAETTAQVYRVVAFEFEGKDRALQVAELVRKGGRANDYKVAAWAVVEVDEKGKTHVKQSGHGSIGTAVGLGAGALLGLIGGPAGLLVWALGGALLGGLAGKYMGHQFDTADLKALTTNMLPNTSAIIVIIEDKLEQDLIKEYSPYDAKVVTLTLGSQISGEVAQYSAIEVGENAEVADNVEAAKPADTAPAAETATKSA